MSKPNDNLKAYWQSLESATRTSLPVVGQSPAGRSEFGPDAGTLVVSGEASRRKFMGILGASTAIAGLTSTGCMRKPKEQILPFAKRPEDRVPGAPVFYATAYQVGGTVMGLRVESQDGRPTKVEGNPQHAGSRGKTDAWAQASVLALYDPERSRKPRSTTAAAYAMPKVGQKATIDELKDSAVKQLCADAYSRAMSASRSIDNARAARDACKTAAKEQGKWATGTTEDGRQFAAVTLRGDDQIEVDWPTLWAGVEPVLTQVIQDKGDKTALVIPWSMSPSFRGLVRAFKTRNPQAKVFVSDSTAPVHSLEAVEGLVGKGGRSHYDLARAKVILAADSDFLGTDTDHVRLASEFAKGRTIERPGDKMSRLYSVEPHLTPTGASADHRIRVRGSQVADFLGAVARAIAAGGLAAPRASGAVESALPKGDTLDAKQKKFAEAVAKDLIANKGEGGVLVGERQPAAVHALGLYINAQLGSVGYDSGIQRVRKTEESLAFGSTADLAAGLSDGSLERVICIGANPAYDAPGSLGLAKLLEEKAKLLIHAGMYRDETGQIADWHIPTSHYLEAWGDLESSDGTKTICQPLIAPIFDTPSALEVLARVLAPERKDDGHRLVRDYWSYTFGDKKFTEKQWRQWLHDGVIGGAPGDGQPAMLEGWNKLGAILRKLPPATTEGIEINFHVDSKMAAGEFSNNAWMQECPHSTTKLVWDNAAYISAQLAKTLRVENGDLIDVKLDDRALSIPVWIAPGQAANTVSLTLGYGRRGLGTVAEDAGFDVNAVRGHVSPNFQVGTASKGSGSYQLVSTQDYGSLDPDGVEGMAPWRNYEERPIYRETDGAGFKKDPDFAKKGDLMPPDRLRALWDRPKLTGSQQWGMSVDLNACTGCNSCVVACQAENNIPVVGKKEAANGREMHWIRIDRYYRGDIDDPEAVMQPMACQHCETAPCENVCPVAATTHSPEGLNDIAYNRCVGTRYCANNCPYKVRRFNFFNYNLDIDPVAQLQKNPDVTVRFRGVVEKCTYCVQRINQAKIDAHVKGKAKVRDGEIVTACQEACPTDAIVFGDVKDSKTRVSKLKAQSRDYAVLQDLFTVPRTTYLGRVRNKNPELG